MTTEDAVVKRLGITPEQLIGYAYGGSLSVLISAIIQPTFIEYLSKSLGGIPVILVALGIGVGIYALYFKVIGDFFLYQLQHGIHFVFDRLFAIPPKDRTSCTGYLGDYLHVAIGYRRAAYEALKASYYDAEACRRTQLLHGELHVLYLTAVETLFAAGYLWVKECDYTPWLWAGGIFLFFGLVADTRQHFIEAAMLRGQDETKVKKFLAEHGFLKPH